MQLDPQIRIKLQRLITDLNIFAEELDRINYVYQKDLFFEKMELLWEYIKSYKEEEIIEIFLHTDEFIVLQKKLERFEQYYERAVELSEAMIINANILQNDKQNVLNFAKNNFVVDNYKMVQKELDLFENKTPKQLVMVGCGPLPETILFIADNTNIPEIIGIDCNQEAVAMAGEVIKAMGHEKKVKLVYSYAEEYNFQKADIVHIANAVNNKDEILNKIAETGKKGVEILVRTPFHLANVINSTVKKTPSQLVIKKSTPVISDFLDSQILLEKLDY